MVEAQRAKGATPPRAHATEPEGRGAHGRRCRGPRAALSSRPCIRVMLQADRRASPWPRTSRGRWPRLWTVCQLADVERGRRYIDVLRLLTYTAPNARLRDPRQHLGS